MSQRSPSSSINSSPRFPRSEGNQQLNEAALTKRKETAERMRKWRAMNAEKNRENDTRCRVYRVAREKFGNEDSAEKHEWIQSEITRRMEKNKARQTKSGCFNENNPPLYHNMMDRGLSSTCSLASSPYEKVARFRKQFIADNTKSLLNIDQAKVPYHYRLADFPFMGINKPKLGRLPSLYNTKSNDDAFQSNKLPAIHNNPKVHRQTTLIQLEPKVKKTSFDNFAIHLLNHHSAKFLLA